MLGLHARNRGNGTHSKGLDVALLSPGQWKCIEFLPFARAYATTVQTHWFSYKEWFQKLPLSQLCVDTNRA